MAAAMGFVELGAKALRRRRRQVRGEDFQNSHWFLQISARMLAAVLWNFKGLQRIQIESGRFLVLPRPRSRFLERGLAPASMR